MNKLIKHLLIRPHVLLGVPIIISKLANKTIDYKKSVAKYDRLLKTAQLLAGDQTVQKFSADWFAPFVTIEPRFTRSEPELYPEGPPNVLGSGFIVDAEGLVITAFNTVCTYESVNIRLFDGQKVIGNIVNIHQQLGLAIIQLEDVNDQRRQLTCIELADFGLGFPIGLPVLTVSAHRYGLFNGLTQGILSTKNSVINVNTPPMNIPLSVSHHSAPVRICDMGGAVVNMDGQVVGINVNQDESNYTYCYMVDTILDYLSYVSDKLLVNALNKKSMVNTRFDSLGLILYELTPERRQICRQRAAAIGRQFVADDVVGVVVWDLAPDRHESLKEVEPLDVITSIDGQKVDSIDVVLARLMTLNINYKIDIQRGTHIINKTVTLNAVEWAFI